MLDVRDLRVDYGRAPALWNVSLTIGDGELVCVVGPNGAGKTTLINALAGMHPAKSGRITLDGCEMTSLAPHKFSAAGVALVPEGRRLFARMTVRENLEIGGYARAIREVNAVGTAVLLVEQNVTMALEIASRAYLLEEGRIAAEGTPAAVFSTPELRRAYLGDLPQL